MGTTRAKARAKLQNKASLTESFKRCVKDEAQLWYDGCVYASQIYDAEEWSVLGYASVKEYVEQELEPHGVSYRIFMYRVQIGKAIQEYNIQPQDVMNIGWTKFREIARLLLDKNIPDISIDLPSLLERAKTSSLRELQEFVQDIRHEHKESLLRKKTPVKFRLYEDQYEILKQAFKTAQELSGTDNDAVNLVYICMDFLVNHSTNSDDIAKLRQQALEISGLDDTPIVEEE